MTYKAVELPMESFEYYCYYGENEAIEDNVYIGGNRYYNEFNKEMIRDLEHCIDDVTNNDNRRQTIVEVFKKEEGSLTEEEIDKIDYIYKQLEEENRVSEIIEYYALLLSIIYDKEFCTGTIRGCVQREWNYIIFPKDREKSVDFIEAVYFGTGKEFMVSRDGEEKGSLYIVGNNIKKELAKEIGCSEEELTVELITGYHTKTVYEYEEI